MQDMNDINELINFQQMAKFINPSAGDIPSVSGLDIYGETINLSGDVCGDHIIFMDFAKRYNLDQRIKRADHTNKKEISKKEGALLLPDKKFSPPRQLNRCCEKSLLWLMNALWVSFFPFP